MEFLEKTGVIFDLDGTLWDSCVGVARVWNRVIKSLVETHRGLSVGDIRGIMGKTIEEIGAIFFPELPPSERMRILSACCEAENAFFRENGAVLYDGVRQTLETLSKKHSLFIVSNCQCGYIEAFLSAHRLENFFADFEMTGRTGRGKGENIKAVILRNGLKKSVYVGDTEGDFAAAKLAGIPFVHAAYGFGEAPAAEHSINSISELPAVLEKILRR